MVRVFYMDEDFPERDPRDENQKNPPVPARFETLNLLNVFYKFYDPKVFQPYFETATSFNKTEFEERFAFPLMDELGYKHYDIIDINEKDMGASFDAIALSQLREHIHEDDEVRVIITGDGYFDIRDPVSGNLENYLNYHLQDHSSKILSGEEGEDDFMWGGEEDLFYPLVDVATQEAAIRHFDEHLLQNSLVVDASRNGQSASAAKNPVMKSKVLASGSNPERTSNGSSLNDSLTSAPVGFGGVGGLKAGATSKLKSGAAAAGTTSVSTAKKGTSTVLTNPNGLRVTSTRTNRVTPAPVVGTRRAAASSCLHHDPQHGGGGGGKREHDIMTLTTVTTGVAPAKAGKKKLFQNKWIRVYVSAGDCLILPKGIYHRFASTHNKDIKALRLFKENPKWLAIYRPTGDSTKSVCRTEYLESVFLDNIIYYETAVGLISRQHRNNIYSFQNYFPEKVDKIITQALYRFIHQLIRDNNESAKNHKILFYFTSSKVPMTGKPWCPDCNILMPTIRDIFEALRLLLGNNNDPRQVKASSAAAAAATTSALYKTNAKNNNNNNNNNNNGHTANSSCKSGGITYKDDNSTEDNDELNGAEDDLEEETNGEYNNNVLYFEFPVELALFFKFPDYYYCMHPFFEIWDVPTLIVCNVVRDLYIDNVSARELANNDLIWTNWVEIVAKTSDPILEDIVDV